MPGKKVNMVVICKEEHNAYAAMVVKRLPADMKLKNITVKYQTDSETVIRGIRNFKKLINGEDKTQPSLVITIDSETTIYEASMDDFQLEECYNFAGDVMLGDLQKVTDFVLFNEKFKKRRVGKG